MKAAKKKRRPKTNTKTQVIIGDIRRQIVSGDLRGGEKLPTYSELEERYQVSRMTMQAVVESLKDDGFVASKERQGLFVSPNPPHENRFGILLPKHERHNRFWRVLISEAEKYVEDKGYEIAVYRDMTKPSGRENLRRDVRNCRLAGLIVTCDPDDYDVPDIFADESIPKIMFAKQDLPSAFHFSLGRQQLIEKSLDQFLANGRKRIAYLTGFGMGLNYELFLAGVQERALESGPAWQFALENFDAADHLMQLLMSLPADRRPDALLIDNDNLVEAAVRGLETAGVTIPDDIEVISHCNWNERFMNTLPVRFIGFDIHKIIADGLDMFINFRQKPIPIETHEIPALFEDELRQKKREGADLNPKG
jgi:DNA-binding LacI/PurR family transcriptional regulator